MDNPLLDSSAPPAQSSLGSPPPPPPALTIGNPPTGPERFHAPKLQNLGDLLDWQRAALQEAIFHGGTSDKNRESLRAVYAKVPQEATLPLALMGMPLPEFLRFGAQHYKELPHPIQGVYDALADTGVDPLTVETLDTGTLAKYALRYGGRVLSEADKLHIPVWGPGLISDVAKAGTRLLNFGGDAINKLGRGRWSEAVGMLNRQRGEQRELYRRLKALDTTAMQGLDKSETSAVQKILHGQLPPELETRVLQNEKVAKAVAARKELTDSIVRMQAAPGSDLEERLGGGYRSGINVNRWQAAPGVPDSARNIRGSTFFQQGHDAERLFNIYGEVGKHPVEGHVIPKTPLHVVETHPSGELANSAIPVLEPGSEHVVDSILKWDKAGKAQAEYSLKFLGVPEKDITHILQGEPQVALDRISAELARKKGFDSIIHKGAHGEPGDVSVLEDTLFHPGAAPPPAATNPLPRELQPFAGHPGEFSAENYREKYFPGHNYEKVVDPNQPAREVNLLGARNPHVIEQAPFKIPSSKVDEFEKAFDGMLHTSARAITANKAYDELAKIYGGAQKIPQEIRDIFTVKIPATGTERSFGEKLQQSIKGLVNLPKLGIVGTTTIHMFNILALLLARAPEQVPIAALHFAKIMRAGGDEAKRFEAMLPAIERGIDVATHEKQLPGILGRVKPMAWMNRTTWNWDTAAKQALSDKYIAAGMKPLEAGVKASNDLVNYANRSPLTGMLQWFMPFATFAEGGAKAVLHSVAKQPPLVELENRLLGGTFLGGGNPKTDTTLYQPPANVGRGLPTYLRSKTSDLVKLPIALGAQALPGGKQFSKWLLSGRTPAGTALDIGTSPVPYLRDAFDLLPVHGGKTLRGYAPDTFGQQALFSSTGVSLPHKPKTNALAPPSLNPLLPPTPTQSTQPHAGNPLLSP